MMHPMFVQLFIETDAEDLLDAQETRRRSGRRSRRSRPSHGRKGPPMISTLI